MDYQEIFSKKQTFFDRWAPNYDILLTTIFYQAVHKRLLEYVELPESPYILDLGCGTGRLLTRLAKQFPDLQGVGVDFSEEMLRQARKQNLDEIRLNYVLGNAESLPLESAQFDAVFNTISFLHYPNPEQVFSEIHRALKPQGKYYLADYTSQQDRFFFPFSPGGLRFYSSQQRQELGERVGLNCVGHYYLLGPVMLTVFEK
ncbi:MAG: class I SAM-dependent methyltransferase [Cyanobacteriota bacterium]|nr:class I SAM-dependent methyltransferase [Cyanobacteriota bacterium]